MSTLPPPPPPLLDLKSTAFHGVWMLIGGQSLSRIVSFVGNVAVVRVMGDAKPLGVATTELHLIHAMCLTLSREGVRRACLRDTPRITPQDMTVMGQVKWEQSARLARLSFVLGSVFITPLLTLWFLYTLNREEHESDFRRSVLMVGISTIVELACEPMFVVAQSAMMYRLRSSLEALGAVARSGATLCAVIFFHRRLEAFAIGYVVMSLVFFMGYSWGLGRDAAMRITCGSVFVSTSSPLFRLAILSTMQGCWKLALAEGENVVMLMMGVMASDRGAFSLAAGLGSLAARLVLSPIEEQVFLLFGKLKLHGEDDDNAVRTRLLGNVTKFASIFGLFFACIGTQYTHLLIRIIYGRTWADGTDAPAILAWYCGLVAVMAINGVTEAFVQAEANTWQLNALNAWLLSCSLLFVLLAVGLTVPMFGGSEGVVAANVIVMCVRIIYNIWFAKTALKATTSQTGLVLFPSWVVIISFCCGMLVTWQSRMLIYDGGMTLSKTCAHVVIGIMTCFALLAIVIFTENDLSMMLINRMRGERKDTKKTS